MEWGADSLQYILVCSLSSAVEGYAPFTVHCLTPRSCMTLTALKFPVTLPLVGIFLMTSLSVLSMSPLKCWLGSINLIMPPSTQYLFPCAHSCIFLCMNTSLPGAVLKNLFAPGLLSVLPQNVFHRNICGVCSVICPMYTVERKNPLISATNYKGMKNPYFVSRVAIHSHVHWDPQLSLECHLLVPGLSHPRRVPHEWHNYYRAAHFWVVINSCHSFHHCMTVTDVLCVHWYWLGKTMASYGLYRVA